MVPQVDEADQRPFRTGELHQISKRLIKLADRIVETLRPKEIGNT